MLQGNNNAILSVLKLKVNSLAARTGESRQIHNATLDLFPFGGQNLLYILLA